MKIGSKACLLAATLLITALPALAGEFLAISNIVEQAASATVQKYPDADDVLINDVVHIEYQPDGTSERWDDTAIKILTEKGKRDHQSLTLKFNTSYASNQFTRVQVIKPDGSSSEVDIAAQSKVMVDPAQMKANIYNPNSKVLQVSVPDLKVGDLLRYCSHETRYKTVVPDTWSDYQVFEHTSPFERMTYRVVAPPERPLRNIALKAEIPGTVSHYQTEKDGKIVYTWEVRNVPRMFDEPNMPTRYTVVQRLLVSTMESWEELSQWYWELCRPRLEATTPEMKAKAEELVKGRTNTLDRIEAIFNFVSQNIRYMGITTEDEAPGYEPHDVCTTFENRYGVCRDKAALLTSMLRLADIEAFPVIIMVGPKKDEEVPQPFFNHAVTAALDDNGEYILMDATDENTKDIFPAYLQNMSYIVARPEGDILRTSPAIPAEKNLLRIDTSGTLDSSGRLSASSRLRFEGINDTVYRNFFSRKKPEERRRFFEGHLKASMPTAELQSLQILPTELRDTSHPLEVELEYTAENLLIESERNKLLNLPRLGGSLGYANFLIGRTGLEKRKYPLFNRMTAGVRETINIATPGNFGHATLPHYQSIDTPQLTWNMEVDQGTNVLSATNTFLLNTVEFSPGEYLVLKQNLKDIEYNLRKKLIFDHTRETHAIIPDVRTLAHNIDIVLEDAGTWRQSSRSKIEILTYAGKKRFSEIKLPYNPAWQHVELTMAKVTLPDGTVKEISADEINVMDAGWVANAPRYPAGRILVANLPGVEVGSIVEYEYVSTVAEKPFFSTGVQFNAHDPIDHKTFTLTAPAGMELSIRNTGIKETHTESNATVTYTWSAHAQPAVRKEDRLPAWWTFNPYLFISTGNWKTYGREVREHLLAATEGQRESVALARKLTDGLAGETEKVVALRDWVGKNLRPAGPGLTELPFSAITSADQTLRERYGNNPDRMVVLYTLLEAARFNPEFVLSGGIPLIPEAARPLLETPSRTAFDTVLIKIDVDGKTIYLNGESQYAQLGTSAFNHRRLLDLDNGKIETLDLPSNLADRSHTVVEMSIGSSGTAGLTQIGTVRGTAFEGFHRTYAEITPENRRRHYLEILSDISQSAKAASELVTNYDTYPGKQEFSLVAERYGVRDGDYLYFTIPGNFGGLLQYPSSTREHPLAWGGYVDILTEFNIILPDGYEPVIQPKPFSWQAPVGAGLIEVAVDYSPRANAIRMVQIADLRPALIPAKDFPGIVKAGRKLAHPGMRTILLKRKRQNNAEAE
jgi:transglutaminase-like putative cysteine protease